MATSYPCDMLAGNNVISGYVMTLKVQFSCFRILFNFRVKLPQDTALNLNINLCVLTMCNEIKHE